jgi:uncharacterized protein (DUF433 family)
MEEEAENVANLDSEIDWTGCDLVERVAGKVSGQPIVRGTRILPGPVVRRFDRGEKIEQIQEDWPSLSVDQIEGLVAFAHAQRGQTVS